MLCNKRSLLADADIAFHKIVLCNKRSFLADVDIAFNKMSLLAEVNSAL